MSLIVLNAKRVKETEGLYKGFNRTEYHTQDGKLKAIVPASAKQPRKGKKTATVNCWTFTLSW